MNFVLRRYFNEWTIGGAEHGTPPAYAIVFTKIGRKICRRSHFGGHYSDEEMAQALAIITEQFDLIAITLRLKG